jgi:hypothetical protein
MSPATRLAIAALLAVALWNPTLPLGALPIDVILLVDDSLSIDRAQVASSWRDVAEALRALPGEGSLSLLRFAAAPAVEVQSLALAGAGATALIESGSPPAARSIDRSHTDLEAALDAALLRVEPGRAARVLLLSDGVETRGRAEAALRALGAAAVPVLAFPAAASKLEGAVWIESLRAPVRGRVGEAIRVEVSVSGGVEGPAELELLVDGEIAERRTLALRPGELERAALELPLGSEGVARLDARLARAGDPRPQNDLRSALVQVQGPPRILYLREDAGPSPLLAGLRRGGGWEVAALHPSGFEAGASVSRPPALLILDDLAVGDMPAAAWRTLESLVRHEGVGLLVLGGPRSFAAGGYRHSLLEGLLPVTAEGRDRRSRAAILFLIDSSGSMERDQRGRHRLELARQAVIQTLRGISEQDLVGVSSFALEPREILPLGRHADPAGRLAAELPAASGGTRLLPALEHAAQRLAQAEAEQRLLVLVTDGFAEGDDLASVRGELADAGVDVVALAVGHGVRLDLLEELAEIGSGAVLVVRESASLPRLMRDEVGERLEPAQLGRFRPRPVTPLPFPSALAASWPPLTGYMVSRPRATASVSLESRRGDPILAFHHAGAGRVVALPAGLGAWAEAWLAWPGWPAFADGLLQWLARPVVNPHLDLRIADTPGGLAFELDATRQDGGWSAEPTAGVAVLDPAGREQALELSATAPGRYSGTLPTRLAGVHRVSVRVGDQVLVRHTLRSADRELAVPAAPLDDLRRWQRAGLLELWPQAAARRALRAPSPRVASRPWLAGLALLAYLLLVVAEETGLLEKLTRRPVAGSAPG